jgi:hypothetical protein
MKICNSNAQDRRERLHLDLSMALISFSTSILPSVGTQSRMVLTVYITSHTERTTYFSVLSGGLSEPFALSPDL